MTNRITPEMVVEAFRETGATPVTCEYGYDYRYHTWKDQCCALGSIGKQRGITLGGADWITTAIQQALGLSYSYLHGVEWGWDTPERLITHRVSTDYSMGFDDGRAARRAVEDAGYTVERG